MDTQDIKIAYFAGEPLGVPVLEALKEKGFLPELIVCNPDRPAGRKRILTPPPVKLWAEKHDIEVWQPTSFKPPEGIEGMLSLHDKIKKNNEYIGEGIASLYGQKWDLFVVVAYNHILPKWLIDIPTHKTLNVHPSLLPLLRGASPIRSAILNDMRDQIGVSVMQLDEKMDHGPLLAQETLTIAKEDWPLRGTQLDAQLAQLGGKLLAETIPRWVAGDLVATEQLHEKATYCGKLDRSMGELAIDPYNLPTGDKAYQILLKIRAFDGFPGTYFMYNEKRIKITDAELRDNQLYISRIIPEGKNEMNFSDFFTP